MDSPLIVESLFVDIPLTIVKDGVSATAPRLKRGSMKYASAPITLVSASLHAGWGLRACGALHPWARRGNEAGTRPRGRGSSRWCYREWS